MKWGSSWMQNLIIHIELYGRWTNVIFRIFVPSNADTDYTHELLGIYHSAMLSMKLWGHAYYFAVMDSHVCILLTTISTYTVHNVCPVTHMGCRYAIVSLYSSINTYTPVYVIAEIIPAIEINRFSDGRKTFMCIRDKTRIFWKHLKIFWSTLRPDNFKILSEHLEISDSV